MDRRQFATTFAACAALHVSSHAFAESPKLSVGVIGHTGRGNYGHGLDVVWNRIPNTSIVGVADANSAGLIKELKKLRLDPDLGFVDHREMLAATKPDLVAVCPRYVDEHFPMIMSAIEAGAKGIYVEKPYVSSPRQADAIITAIQSSGTKIAVAHRNRYHPVLKEIDAMIERGELGRLLEIRGRGKGDRRGGIEDLWVLGSHVLNLITYFGGDPVSCSALLLQDGRPVSPADVRKGNEGIGKVAGNEFHARFLLDRNVTATLDSVADDGTENQGFGLRLIGSKGQIDIKCDGNPLAHYSRGNPFRVSKQQEPWTPVTVPSDQIHDYVYSHEAAARDLIRVLGTDEQPLCDARRGAQTIEMIASVMWSHRLQREVTFPIPQRDHPLDGWS